MLDWLRFALGALMIGGGLFVLVSAVLGLFRFRYALNRIHAAALVDTLGIMLTVCGLILCAGFTLVSLKLALVVVFLWCTSPVASHLLARLEVTITEHPEKQMTVDDPALAEQTREDD